MAWKPNPNFDLIFKRRQEIEKAAKKAKQKQQANSKAPPKYYGPRIVQPAGGKYKEPKNNYTPNQTQPKLPAVSSAIPLFNNNSKNKGFAFNWKDRQNQLAKRYDEQDIKDARSVINDLNARKAAEEEVKKKARDKDRDKGVIQKFPGKKGIGEIYIPSEAEKAQATKDLQKKRDAMKRFDSFRNARYADAIKSGSLFDMQRAAKDEVLWSDEARPASETLKKSQQRVADVLSGKYIDGVTEKDYKKWMKNNTYKKKITNTETGEKEEVTQLKWNAVPPPTGRNSKGEKIDISDDWKYVNMVNFYKGQQEKVFEDAQKEKAAMLADANDDSNSTFNSTADAIKSVIAGEGFGGFKDYWKNYLWKPLKSGNYSILGMNLLNDLGETVDIFGNAFRKGVTENSIYGAGNLSEGLFKAEDDPNKGWVYSGGKETQKKLVDMGLLDMMKPTAGSARTKALSRTVNGPFNDKQTEQLKAAGLYEEALKFKSEYDERDLGVFWEGVKKGFTDHEIVRADTGNAAGDVFAEIVFDPTLVLGSAASVGASAAAKGTAKGAVKAGLKAAGTSLDDLGKAITAADKITKSQLRTISGNLFSKNSSTVKNSVAKLAENFVNNGTLDTKAAELFQNTAIKELNSVTDKRAFNAVKALHYADAAFNFVDMGLLKASTAVTVPYVAFKIPQLARKGIRKSTYYAKYVKRQGTNRVIKGLADPDTGAISIMNADETIRRLKEEYVSEEIAPDIIERFNKQTEIDANEMNRIIESSQDSGVKFEDVEGTRAALDDYISTTTGGQASTPAEYLEYLEQANNKYKGVFDDTISTFKRQYDKMEDWLENTSNRNNIRIVDDVNSSANPSEAVRKIQGLLDDGVTTDSKFINDLLGVQEITASKINTPEYRNLDNLRAEYSRKRGAAFAQFNGTPMLDEVLLKLNDEYVEPLTKLKELDTAIQSDIKNALRASENRYSTNMVFKKEPVARNTESVNPSTDNEIMFDKNRVTSEIPEIEESWLKVRAIADDYLKTEILSKGLSEFDEMPVYLQKLQKIVNTQGDQTIGRIKSGINEIYLDLLNKSIFDNLTSFETEFFESLSDLNKKISVEELNITPEVGREYVRFQQDKFYTFTKYMKDETFSKIMTDVLDPKTALGRLIQDTVPLSNKYARLRNPELDALVQGLDYNALIKAYNVSGAADDMVLFYKALQGTSEFDRLMEVVKQTDITNPTELLEYVKQVNNPASDEMIQELLELRDNALGYQSFLTLWNKLENSGGAITERDMWAVLDSVFNKTNVDPVRLSTSGTVEMNKLIERINLHLNSTYGETVISLDGFRKEARDFNSSVYEKYSEEVQDATIQKRINTILEGGHEDPLDDVRTQMLQTILRDPDSIEYYNNVSKTQDVLFTDIETRGLNSDVHEITNIACKRWEPVSDNPTMDEILTMLEKSDTNKTYKTLSPEGILRQDVTDKILEINYKNNPRIPNSRTARLAEYMKRFGSEANGGQEITEKQMLSDFIRDMDTSFISRNENTPMLVVHNNNGFDMDFIMKRLQKPGIQEYPAHIKNLQDLYDLSENTFSRIKRLEDDAILTLDQEKFIRDTVSEYANDLSKVSKTMEPVKPGRIAQGLININDQISRGTVGRNVEKPRLDGQIELPNVTNFRDTLDYVWTDEGLQNQLTKLADDMQEAQKRMLSEVNATKSMIAENPFKIRVEGLNTDNWMRYFDETELPNIERAIQENDIRMLDEYSIKLRDTILTQEHNYTPSQIDSLMKMIRKINDSDNIPRYGYKKAFVTSEASQYFNVLNKTLSETEMHRIQNFTKKIDSTINKRLKSNELLEGHLEDFQAVIQYVQEYSLRLSPLDDFYFLQHVRVPETLNEAYVMAQEMWDLLTSRTMYNEASEYIGKPLGIDEIPVNLRNTVITLNKFGAEFDIKSQVSEAASDLLDNVDDMFHHQIFNNVDNPDLSARYINDLVGDDIELRAMLNEFRSGDINFEQANIWYDTTDNFKAKTNMISNILSESTDAFEYFSKLPVESQVLFQAEQTAVHAERRKLFSAQIMDHIVQSEDNLVSHLLFNNQLLIIPKNGDDIHTGQITKLLDNLSKESKYVESYTQGDYIHIGLKKEWTDKLEVINDSRFVDEEATMRFLGDDKTFKAPRYERIPIDTSKFSDQNLAKFLANSDAKISRLSNGESAGSLNIMHTMKKQKELYRNLPTRFVDNILDVDFTCNERFWHNANFDRTLLGDADNCWKVANQNDSDMLFISRQVTKEASKKAESQAVFLDGFFGAQEQMGIKSMFPPEFTDKQIADALKNSREHVVVTLRDHPSNSSGVQLQQIKITDELSVAQAAEQNAIIVPYPIFEEMFTQFNMDVADNVFFKVWTRAVHMCKVGYLCYPGTWIRNYMDATIKSIGDTGTPGSVLKNQVKAMQLLQDYKQVSNIVENMRGINHRTNVDLERIWPSLSQNPDVKLTYEQFVFMEGWMKEGVSGGESRTMKSIFEKTQKQTNVNQALQGNDGYDLIASDYQKFEQLPAEDVIKMFQDANITDNVEISLDDFMAIFTKQVTPSNTDYLRYTDACDLLINFKSQNMVPLSKKLNNGYQAVTNALLSPMSGVEEVIRLAEFLTLEEQGFTKNEIFKIITDSQFNYDIKGSATRFAEMMIPFYNFEKLNLIYWCRQITENPRMLRYLEKIWGELSWDSSEYTPEEIVSNASLQSSLLSGNINLGNSGAYFKANPSFMSPLQWIQNAPSNLLEKIWNPVQNIFKDALYEMGAASWGVFDETTFWDRKADEDVTSAMDIITKLPLVGTAVERYVVAGKRYWERLSEGHRYGILGAAVRAFPDVFGVISAYNRSDYDSFAEFQAGLAKQGRWYNQNTGKVESLSTYNEEGLNALRGDQDWDTLVENKRLYQGLYWDANKNKFVSIDQFEPGGLNREFDFGKEGEWDEFLRLKKKYQGLVWDNNTRSFVKPEELSKGKLNQDNLSWDQVCFYNKELFGTVWDQNQGKFVHESQLISGGLNDENLTWGQLTALKLAVHGEQWDSKNRKWVKVRDPLVKFGTPKYDYTELSPIPMETRNSNRSLLEILGLVAPTWADEGETPRRRTVSADQDPWTLIGEPEHDKKVFERILAMGIGEGFGSGNGWKNYTSGYAGDYKYNRRSFNRRSNQTSFTPKPRLQTTEPYRFARSAQQGIRSGGKVYSRPYQYDDNQSGLRMATSGYPAYDEYYNFEYKQSYKYRNPQKGVADYPQTKLGIQRYARLRSKSLLNEQRLKDEYKINNIASVRHVGVKARLNQIKLHWWQR